MIPNGWTRTPIKDLCEFVNGNGFKPSEWSDQGLPIIRIQNLNGSNNFNYFSGEPKESWIVSQGDILFAWAGTKGVSFGAKRWNGEKGVLNQHIFRVIPKGKVDSDWLYLAMLRITQHVENKAHGFKSTLLHVQKSDITSQLLDIPPLCEQKEIARILSIWGEAINANEQLIDKSQQQKKSLMHHLLTGDEECLRSENWTLKSLGSLSSTITSGSRDWAQYYSDNGSKFVRMTNLNREGIYLKLDDLKYVNVSSTSADGKRTSLEYGDILISITAELGKIGWVPSDFGEAFINQHTALVRLNGAGVDSKFIAYLLSSYKMRKALNRLNDAGAKAGLNLSTIRSFKIEVPPLREQQKIAKILTASDNEIKTLQQKLTHLKQEKKALMQQLLTGKRRVKLDNATIPNIPPASELT